MHSFHQHIESYRIAMAGLLVVLGVHIFSEIITTVYIGVAIAAIAIGVLLSKLTARHFDHGHNHVGDSAIDAVPIVVLLFANIAHPAIDGFSAVETFAVGGVLAGVLYTISIIFHEIIRQSAFVAALKPLYIDWKWVTGTALLGIILGVMAAFAGSSFFERYEFIADIATVFSYSFVIAEFYFLKKNQETKNPKTLFYNIK